MFPSSSNIVSTSGLIRRGGRSASDDDRNASASAIGNGPDLHLMIRNGPTGAKSIPVLVVRVSSQDSCFGVDTGPAALRMRA